ncbi:MAG: DUF924 family protein [Nannocystis sp.]|nr:DUF924 family protein [Nannocystis sp.]MBA3548923.1 DUF924 family protein [Nannocystis sp.]
MTAISFDDLEAVRVWNYWFAHRDISRSPAPVCDPFTEDYVFDQALWFRGGPEVDAEIRRHFEALALRAAAGELDHWRETVRGCLALVILLDQFPRHIHRGTARAFIHDPLALALARHALTRGLDRQLAPAESLFLWLPLAHSEQLPEVREALAGVGELATRCTRGQQRIARSWQVSIRKHIDMLERFGRYPRRNAALGRESTALELAFLERPEFSAMFMRSPKPPSAAPPSPGPAPAPQTQREPRPDAPQRPRLKILALHGLRQNGDSFRARTRKLRQALEDIAEFTYVTSPMQYSPQGDTRAATLDTLGEIPEYATQRVWWRPSEDNLVYEGFDGSVVYLEAVFREQGPFDGVIGFSQGGTLAAVLAAMLPHPTIAFRFAICISSFPSRARAHARHVEPQSVKLPALHVLGLNDVLVPPDRSIKLFEVFDPATSTLVKHSGGHFVPGAWPYTEIHAFAARFLDPNAVAPKAATTTAAAAATPGVSLLGLACEALGAPSLIPPAFVDVALVQSVVHEMAAQEQWRELQALAVHAHAMRTAADGARPEASALVAVHEEIVDLFAQRLKADLAAAADLERAKPVTTERTARLLRLFAAHGVIARQPAGTTAAWPSQCAREASRVGSQPDKACRLARDIAVEVFGHEAMSTFIAAAEQANAGRAGDTLEVASAHARRRARQDSDAETLARHLAYQRYGQALSLITGVLTEMDPEHAREQQRKLRAVRADTPERIAARRTLPISSQVSEPEPEPVVPCSLVDLDPLLGHLRANLDVDRQTAFSKGTLTTDGRLDLCKQVVGPDGIGPLLGAMMHTDRVKRLLLGNNIVGDDGAAAIAGFLRERHDSPLDCWYIAGNRIGPRGIMHVCEALATDTRVTSLWLKRNPLKAEGMVPIAGLLRRNTTLEVLDLVNCGLLDAGLETVLGALMGPGANKTLRHLYLGTNGITERSAPLIARFLAEDCVLESFYLSCNRLGDEGVEAVARGLAANHTIQRVSLASNCIGPRGAAALADALAEHPSIALLDLGFTKATVAVGELGNFIGDAGAQSLAQMLRTNTTLRSLDLLHNYISQTGVNHLREALKVNQTLVWLQLTQFGKIHNVPGKEELRAALQRNRAQVPDEQSDRIEKINLPDHITEIYSVYRTHS